MGLSVTERRRAITEHLCRGEVGVADLARQLKVSEMTIRRDLAVLEHEDKLLRVYGGAVSRERLVYEFSFKEKQLQNKKAKEAIGYKAAGLVRPEDVVFIDTGSTALAVGRALRPVRPRVIVTINLCVASEFIGQNNTRVLVPGGELSPHSPDLYGEWTLQTLSQVNVDVAFLGCDAVSLEEGFYTADTKVAAVSKLMLSRSQKNYLVTDSSKFGHKAMCLIAKLDQLDAVITDKSLPARYRNALRKAGIKVLI